jgi:hypothetical protein
MRRIGLSFSLFVSAATAACAVLSGPGQEDSDQASSSIINEQVDAGGGEVGNSAMARRYVDHPTETRVGWAVGQTLGADRCTGWMIGPSLMLSAAHCGLEAQRTMRFWRASNQDPRQPATEDYTCQFLLSGWPDTDLMLFYCPTDATHPVPPGVKYGYVGLDRTTPSINEPVFSVWWNTIEHPADGLASIPNAMILSQGAVSHTDTAIWGTTPPSGTCLNPTTGVTTTYPLAPYLASPMFKNVGLTSTAEAACGASGSPLFNQATYKVLGAPLSTGGGSTIVNGQPSCADALGNPIEAPLRNQLPISVALAQTVNASYGECANGAAVTRASISAANIAALVPSAPLNPSKYAAPLDANGDFVIDLQEDFERAVGEPARDWYDLGFDFEQRNALWSFSTNATLPSVPSFTGTSARIVSSGGGSTASPVYAMSHSRLNLAAGTPYRVGFQTIVNRADPGAGLVVALFGASGIVSSQFVPLVAGPQSGQAMQLQTANGGETLWFGTVGAVDVNVAAIVVARDGSSGSAGATPAVMDFDTADKRAYWKNQNNGTIAPIVPDGTATGTGASWAGLVQPHTGGTAGNDWPLRNTELALVPGTSYTLCFKAMGAAPKAGDSGLRVASVFGPSGPVPGASITFTPPTSWSATPVCTGTFVAPAGGSNVRFGFADGTGATPYLVDEIVVRNQCVAQPTCGGTSACGAEADGCGRTVNCGTCGQGFTCLANTCECTPRTCKVGYLWDYLSCQCEPFNP